MIIGSCGPHRPQEGSHMEPHSAPISAPIRDTPLHRELRSRILIQYSILRDNPDYVYNPSALTDYVSYDPGILLSMT